MRCFKTIVAYITAYVYHACVDRCCFENEIAFPSVLQDYTYISALSLLCHLSCSRRRHRSLDGCKHDTFHLNNWTLNLHRGHTEETFTLWMIMHVHWTGHTLANCITALRTLSLSPLLPPSIYISLFISYVSPIICNSITLFLSVFSSSFTSSLSLL